VGANVRKRLAVSNQAAEKFAFQRNYNLRKRSNWKLGKSIKLKSQTILMFWGTSTIKGT
jgi:hypothetical protein